MDDLLIVRMSDRSKERYQQRRHSSPIALNLSLVCAIGFGFALAGISPDAPAPFFAFGAVTGGLLGAVAMRFLGNAPSRQRHARRPDLYDGLPFDNSDLDSGENDSQS